MADPTIYKTAGPPQIVLPPASSPILHGLLGSITPIPTDPDGRWLLGLTWVPDVGCGLSWGTWVPCPIDEAGDPVTGQQYLNDPDEIPEVEEYQPFEINVASSCSPGTDTKALRRRAIAQIEAVTEWALSSEFWHGTRRPTNFALVQAEPTLAVTDDLGQYPNGGVLNPGTDPDDPTVECTAVTPEQALDLLIDAMARCGGAVRGTIHASYGLVARWTAGNRIRVNGGKLNTTIGGHLVIGHFAKPDGPLDRTSDREAGEDGMWAYGTGPVELRLTEPEVIEDMPTATRQFSGSPLGALHARTNRLSYRVERNAAVTTDPCCVFAVRVTPLA